MQRRIYLLRHGDVSYFSSDGQPVSFQHAALNDHGIAQAIALGEILAPIVFQKYVFSGLLRSHQTMDLVVGKREAGSSPDFLAYPDFGEIQPGAIHTFPGTDFYQPLARGLTLILVLWVGRLFLISPIVSTFLFALCLKILPGQTPWWLLIVWLIVGYFAGFLVWGLMGFMRLSRIRVV